MKILYGIFQSGKLPGFMQKRLDKKSPEDRAYMEKMLTLFGVDSRDMAFVKRESILNQFYSDLVTPLDNQIAISDTQIYIFYAVKMGGEYERRYLQHFKNPDIHCHDMQHEELLARYPEQWADKGQTGHRYHGRHLSGDVGGRTAYGQDSMAACTDSCGAGLCGYTDLS